MTSNYPLHPQQRIYDARSTESPHEDAEGNVS